MAAWVYIMANRRFGTVYVGATGDLIRRVWEHKNEVVPAFTKEHHCHLLVYFEEHQDMYRAMQRERSIKHWMRAWKDELIEKDNPEWDDLYLDWGTDEWRAVATSTASPSGLTRGPVGSGRFVECTLRCGALG